ncbi:hypothetical protein [Bradyrhizobium erythrophlei]|jgi:hypothetical protein|uniref:hypothetical protein n=1 Tax=Bradyrhizobium erythrophlei TaxID=1437360 RepID=UPI0012EC55A8|nr:hypothetical protein [Bradyrhizobium erythrophlei]
MRSRRIPQCGGFGKAGMGAAMKKEDLKEMASRCRLIARKADKFTRIRLLELASKYEAQLERRSPPVKSAYRNDHRGKGQ